MIYMFKSAILKKFLIIAGSVIFIDINKYVFGFYLHNLKYKVDLLIFFFLKKLIHIINE